MERKFFNLQKGEKVVEDIKPLRVLRWYIFIKWFLIAFFIMFWFFIPLLVGAFFAGSEYVVIYSVGFLAFVLILIYLLSGNAYGHRYYWVTNKRVIYKRGILGYTVSSIPLERISDVIVSRTLLERIFGFGSILIQSMAGQVSFNRKGSEGALSAVPDPEGTQQKIFDQLEAKRKSEHLTM